MDIHLEDIFAAVAAVLGLFIGGGLYYAINQATGGSLSALPWPGRLLWLILCLGGCCVMCVVGAAVVMGALDE